MKAQEIIKNYKSNGGLDMYHIMRTAKAEGVTIKTYIRNMVKNEFTCSYYIANKVAEYFI